MSIDTQKLRDFAQWIERRYPEGTARGVVEAADHIDAQASEIAELGALCKRQSDLLSQTAIAIRGPEPELTLYSHADIPSRVKTVVDERDAQAAEIERLREALEWYQGKSKAMASAAISGDRRAMINLMQEIAVDYGKRGSAALSGEGK